MEFLMTNELSILRWVHILAMVYWLGGEWGVFQKSYNVPNRELSLEERKRHMETAYRIDILARTGIVLLLPLGLHMGKIYGFVPFLEGTGIWWMWLFFAVWLAMALWPGVNVGITHWWAVLWFGVMGAAMLSLLGVLTSIWAEKFDHAAAVTNFVVAPLALLSGTFYSIDRLSPAFQAVSHANPFFYAISGFRYGFLGEADSPVALGALILLAINIALTILCYALLKSGWKIKS